MSQSNPTGSMQGSSGTTNNKDIQVIKSNQIALHNTTEELKAVIADLEQKLSRYQTKPVKLASPEKFDGTRNKLRAFMAQISIHLDANHHQLTTEEKKIGFVAAHLTGSAMEWFEGYLTDYKSNAEEYQGSETRAIFASYEYFCRKLTMTFGDVEAERVAERELVTLQ